MLKLGRSIEINTLETALINSGLLNLYSIDFDGTDDHITLGNQSAFSFGNGIADEPFSFSFWAKFDDHTQSGVIAKDDTGRKVYQMVTSSADKLRFRLYDESTDGYIQVQINAALTSSAWNHYVCSYDGGGDQSGLRIFVNGSIPTQTQSLNGDYTAMEVMSSALTFGTQERGNFFFDGRLDEVSLWGAYLTPVQITEIYNGGSPSALPVSSTTQAQLLGWWRMGDTLGTGSFPTIIDQSITNTNNGTMTNMASGDIQTDVP